MRFALLAACIVFAGAPAVADEFEPALRAFLEDELRAWAQAPVLVDAIRAMNVEREGYDQATIDAMDAAWQDEVGTGNEPTVAPILENPAADFLREQVAISGGRITEAFIFGAHGLNVAATAPTSDMWQGDEAKYLMTYGVGAGAVHIGNVEFDESTQQYQGQISLTITDPETGDPIGAITVGVDARALL